MKFRIPLVALLMLLSGCASAPDGTATDAPSKAAAAINDVPAEGLPPQRLEPGQCGLFLWGMSAPRKFVFFTEGTAGSALVLVDDKPVSMPQVSAGGEVFGQFLTVMRYRDQTTGAGVSVSLTPGEVLEGGQRVDTGHVLFRDPDGWETILPVTGVRACMPG